MSEMRPGPPHSSYTDGRLRCHPSATGTAFRSRLACFPNTAGRPVAQRPAASRQSRRAMKAPDTDQVACADQRRSCPGWPVPADRQGPDRAVRSASVPGHSAKAKAERPHPRTACETPSSSRRGCAWPSGSPSAVMSRLAFSPAICCASASSSTLPLRISGSKIGRRLRR